MFDILQVMGRPEPEKKVPASITCCTTWPEFSEGRVRRYAATALYTVTDHVKPRLANLFARDLEGRWNDPMSPERYWFGMFSRLKADKVRRTFDGIARHLANPNLKIVCDDTFDSYGSASPGVLRIKVGRDWRTPATNVHADGERVQTFVHEAAHICGRTSGLAENNFYGRSGAHTLTRWRMRATRNADNYGYYAIDLPDWADHAILS